MNKLMILLLVLLFLPLVTALDNSYVVGNISLKVPCVDEFDNYCDSSTECFLTVLDKDKNVILDSVNMTYNNSFFTYLINSSLTVGEYVEQVLCTDGVSSGYVNSEFQVKADGDSVLSFGYCPSDSRGIIMFVVVGVLLMFFTLLAYSLIKVAIIEVFIGIMWVVFGLFMLPCMWIMGGLITMIGVAIMLFSVLGGLDGGR